VYFIKNRLIFLFIILIISCLIFGKIFYPIYTANEIIIEYGIKPFDICSENPQLWEAIKIIYIFTFVFTNLIINNLIFNNFFSELLNKKEILKKEKKENKNELKILIGQTKDTKKDVYVEEKGMYQNFLITGTIGSGKTSSAMYPFTRQLIEYNAKNKDDKIGMLILDVKGNYYNQVKEYCTEYGLQNDLIVIELGGKEKYNPLHKPNLKPQVLANRLKIILELFSEKNSESFWLDKAEQVLAESIKLCRLYNNGYVTFAELHKLITRENYYKEKIEYLRKLFISSKFNFQEIYDLNSSLEFFQNEFTKLDSRTMAILKSEITRITNTFISDFDISKTFSPNKESLTFSGFSECIEKGKIVVLNMNIAEYRNLSKIIAAYLKLDFQTEVMQNLSKGTSRKTAFICDEYSEYVTKTDSEFFSLSREAKCINIVSTQSYSSLKETLHDEAVVKVIIQNLINKIWFRTDDMFTIEEAQKQIGKEDKTKVSKTISENAKETKFNYFTNSLNSMNSSISESYNTYSQNDFVFDTKFFTQNLETFNTLAFLTDGNKIIKPCKLQMFPYFYKRKEGNYYEK
jgi:hypothetical protein